MTHTHIASGPVVLTPYLTPPYPEAEASQPTKRIPKNPSEPIRTPAGRPLPSRMTDLADAADAWPVLAALTELRDWLSEGLSNCVTGEAKTPALTEGADPARVFGECSIGRPSSRARKTLLTGGSETLIGGGEHVLGRPTSLRRSEDRRMMCLEVSLFWGTPRL